VGVLVLLAGYATVAGLDRASRRHFWYDEICTVAIANLGSASAIWSALEGAADGNPPAFYVIESLLRNVSTNPHVSFRFVSVLGYVLLLVAVFVFVRRISDDVTAAMAMALPFLTPLFTLYAVDARPYSVLLACIGWAMVMWQQAHRAWAAIAMAMLLAGGVFLHYYAILAVVPFAIAELARWHLTRERRLAVLIGLGLTPFALLVQWPLLQAIREYYGEHFWAPTRLVHALITHDRNLELPDWWGGAIALVISAGLAWRVVRGLADSRGRKDVELSLFLLALINLPVFAVIMTRVLGGGLTSRYVLASVVGIVVALALAAARRGPRVATAFLALIVIAVGLRELDYWRSRGPLASAETHLDNVLLAEALRTSPGPALPLVISNGSYFLPMSYYGGPHMNEATYLVDRAAAVTYSQSDSVDASLARIAQLMPLVVMDRQAFLARHPAFLMFSKPDRFDWLYAQLVSDGFAIRPIWLNRVPGGHRVLYLVDRRKAGQ
jgi:hypothetical protein